MGTAIIILILIFPFALTGWNIFTFIQYLMTKKEKSYCKITEVIAICMGIVYLIPYTMLADIVFTGWDTQLSNNQIHSMISPDAFPTVLILSLIALSGYLIIRYIPVSMQSPIVSALGISAVYIGIGLCVLWCIQTIRDFFLVLFPANCILIFLKAVSVTICEKNRLIQSKAVSTKYKKLPDILNKAANLPWAALLLTIPLLGIIIIILCLFGQAPDSIIKAWTETANWTMSQKTAPPNVIYDEHYLCTVAAGGHRKAVKPIREGIRHGHRVIVNRQLCIANAFEQILEEKTPAFHKIVRTIYNKTGYPLSRHIRSKYTADIIYYLMKPLEWFFLIILYAVDVKPENRIAVQYPHAPVPDTFQK